MLETLKINEILEGWANNMKDKFGRLDPEMKKLAANRMSICNKCIVRTNNWCSPLRSRIHKTKGIYVKGCGCNLSAKTMSKNAKCPAGEW